jgi:hypothetical protein
MSAEPSSCPRWIGYCHGCQRDDREVQTRYERAAKTLCDECSGSGTIPSATPAAVLHRQSASPSLAQVEPPGSGLSAVQGQSRFPEPRATDTSNPPFLTAGVTPTSSSSLSLESDEVRAPLESRGQEVPLESRGTDALIADHKAGAYEPVAVSLPNLPPNAPPLMHRIAADFAYVTGLRFAVGDSRPVPYASRWVASRVKVSHVAVQTACRYLVEHGVLSEAGVMPGRGKRGTKLYVIAADEFEEAA